MLFSSVTFPSSSLNYLPPTISCTEFGDCLLVIFGQVLGVLLYLAFALAVIFIIYAGISYITSRGKDVEKIHKMLIYAIVGFVVALSSYVLVQVIESTVRNIQQQPQNCTSPPCSYNIKNFLLAQSLQAPKPPTSLRCGVKSVLESGSSPSGVWSPCLLEYVAVTLGFLYYFALVLGTAFIIWSGILYITKSEKSQETHKKLIWGIVGIIIAILSFIIVKMINLFIEGIGQ
jgi:FtsH-binding integral membrane protein